MHPPGGISSSNVETSEPARVMPQKVRSQVAATQEAKQMLRQCDLSFIHHRRSQKKSKIEIFSATIRMKSQCVEVFKGELGCGGWSNRGYSATKRSQHSYHLVRRELLSICQFGVGPLGTDGDPRRKAAGPQSGEQHFFNKSDISFSTLQMSLC